MHPPKFEYIAPASLDEAIRVLQQYDGDAKLLAGGQSLLPLMKLRLARPRALVDLGRIPDLAYVREEGGSLRIGAMTRTNDLGASGPVRSRYPILSDAASVIADPLVRNMGTVGGNLSHGDPSNDLPACMVALDATYALQGPTGARTVRAREFYRDTFVTALGDQEILTEIRIPAARAGQGNAYVKLERRAGDFPIVGIAANLVVDPGGAVREAGLGLTAVGPTVLDASSACNSLLGRRAGEADIAAVARQARALSKPVSTLQGTAEYKGRMVELFTRKAVDRAYRRARGGT